jgi:hypothetical protein
VAVDRATRAGRGGFYSYDFVENVVGCDIHSAERVVPEWQSIVVGDAVHLHPEVALIVAVLEPGRALVPRGGVPIGRTPPPYDLTWAFVLRDQADGSTRLVVRERYRYSRRWARLLVEPAELISFVMSQRMLRGIKERAERSVRSAPTVGIVSSTPTTPRPTADRPVTTSAHPTRRFTRDMLAGFDEPVGRYFSHAISDGAALPNGVRMAMSGHIKVGLWLPFTAEQTVDGRSFAWRARVGWGPLTPLRVTDQYADAAGSTEGRLLGRVTLFHAEDLNTARSAATRAAIESVVFAPPSVLPGRGVTW